MNQPAPILPRALAAALLLLAAPLAAAQVERLTRDFVSASSISADERDALREWASAQLERLRTGDQPTREQARQSLLSPFDGRAQPSIAFRLEYARAIAPDIRRLVTDDSAPRAIAALLIAGKCGAPEMIDPLERALDDDRASIRGAAAAGLKDVILQVREGQLPGDSGARAADVLLDALADETDLNAASLYMIALAEARDSALHRTVAEGLADALPSLIDNLRPSVTPDTTGRTAACVGRGVETIFRAMINPNVAPGADPEFLGPVCVAAAHALPFGVELLENPGPGAYYDTQEGWRIRAMMSQAEQSLLIAERRLLDLPDPRQARIPDQFDNAVRIDDARRVAEVVNELIGLAADLSGAEPDDLPTAGR